MGYNQFTISNYRNTLAKQCTGRVSNLLTIDIINMRRLQPQPKILQTAVGPDPAGLVPQHGVNRHDKNPSNPLLQIHRRRHNPHALLRQHLRHRNRYLWSWICRKSIIGLGVDEKVCFGLVRVCKKNGRIILMN